MNAKDTVPGVSVDIKKNRIRIHRHALTLINTPPYYRILINPDARCLILERCDASTIGARPLTRIPAGKGCYELYSKDLVQRIQSCAGYTDSRTVSLYGEPINGGKGISFPLGIQASDPNPSYANL